MPEVKEDTMVDRGFQRHEQDPKNWTEEKPVTGRPNDLAPGNSTLASRKNNTAAPPRPEPSENSTLSERKKKTAEARKKAVKGADAENKAVTRSESKAK